MLAYFKKYEETLEIAGKEPEKAVLTRSSRTASSNFKENFVYKALLEDQSCIENGDIATCVLNSLRKGIREKTFLVVAVRHSDYSSQAILYECNGIAEVWRPTEVYNEDEDLIGYEVEKVAEVPTNHVTVNDHMRLLDPGLLPTATKEFRVPKCDIKEMDRIILRDMDGVYSDVMFCIDAIDRTKFPGLLAVQTSNDNRTLNPVGA